VAVPALSAPPDVAAPSGPAPAATRPAVADDLGGLENEAPPSGEPKLDVYGFSDFTYWHPLMAQSNRWMQVFNPYPSFAVGNLNIYLSSSLGDRLKSLVEFRLLYLPNGAQTMKDQGTPPDTTVIDPAEFGREIQWGGISIERAWLEYAVHERLTIRVGQWLTPYGIWNVDHGSPTIIGIRRPYLVREQLFPEWQTGIEAYGTAPFGSVKLGYHLTISNGRGPTDAYRDFDTDKPIGARVFLQYAPRKADLTVGASFYRGRYTARAGSWVTDAAGAHRVTVITRQYDELAAAADVRWQWGGLLAQGELIFNDRAYTADGRPLAQGSSTEFVPDFRRWGAYGLFGYRFAFLGLMPYAHVEYYELGSGALPPLVGLLPVAVTTNLGINLRPWPSVVLKLEFERTTFPGAAVTSFGRDDITALQAQVAWVF